MRKFLNWLDDIAETNRENVFAKWLERTAFFFLILMVLSAPHSIAATQTAWLTGMFAWLIRLFISPRPKLFKTALDLPLWLFFGWSLITSLTSYAPDISIDKMRGVALFLIFYFVINQLKSIRAVKFLALALVFSCMFNVLWTPLERVIGRGVEIHGIAENSLLTKAIYVENNFEPIVLKDGDTLVKIGKKKIHSPEDLLAELEQNETVSFQFYRPDYYLTVQIKRADLLNGTTANEKLGFESWKKSRNWRSSGFFGHWTTYGEVLQLILSLTFGLFIASILRRGEEEKRRRGDKGHIFSAIFRLNLPFLPFSFSPLLLFCILAMSFALLLNVTRASQLAFLVAAFAIVFVVNRKMVLVLAVIILPLVLGGLLFLQQSRNVGFFDTNDDSIKYRQTVYREGSDLWTENVRHFTLGVGMDSIKRYAKDWRLFDDGKLPQGHFHSTPLQLVVERGFPALLLWLWILWIYAKILLRRFSNPKFEISDPAKEKISSSPLLLFSSSWIERGILLGIFGGLVGFFTSGLVHYNLGDAEVAMIFFILMAFGMYAADSKLQISNSEQTQPSNPKSKI